MARDSVHQQVAREALGWIRGGRRVAAAVLIAVEGSAPLDPGATMWVDAGGGIEGSITGGCIESAVVQEALELFASDGPARLLRHGISDELAGSVGLMCGGAVQVLLHELAEADRPAARRALEAILADRPAALATLVDGDGAGRKLFVDAEVAVGTLGRTPLLDHNVAREARGLLAQGRSAVRTFGEDGSSLGDGLRVQVTTHGAPPAMVVVGANDFAAAIAGLARWFGYEVTLVDARPAFLASKRFSAHARTVQAWPDAALAEMELGERDAVVVCTHDPKFDTPALMAAFATGAGYVGALGSRRTTADRTERLREAGARDEDLARVHAPCGLDIGAATIDETALAVLAEIVAERAGRQGGPLRDGAGPIRREHADGATETRP